MRLKFQKVIDKQVLTPQETSRYMKIVDIYMEKRTRQQKIGIWGEQIAKDILVKTLVLDNFSSDSRTFEDRIIQKQSAIIRGLLLAYLGRYNDMLKHQFDLNLDWLIGKRTHIETNSKWEEGLSQFKYEGKLQKILPLSMNLPMDWIIGANKVQQILSNDEYEMYCTILSLLSQFIYFEKFKQFLDTEELIQTFTPHAETIIHHKLDCWAKKPDNTLPIYCIEIKSSDITCENHSQRGPISDRMGKLQREYIKKLMKLNQILKVLIAKVNFCECDHVFYWLIEVEH
ncbi:MAG: hypothetical protein ACFFB5_06390 [Promethearchaeota archaeon]